MSSTDVATFRFEKTLLDQLRLEAKQRKISLNALLNQVVRTHVEWHANATRAGFIPVRKKLVTTVFESLTEEKIDAIAKSLSQDLSDGNLMALVREHTSKAWLKFMESWLEASGISYQRENTGDYVTYVIQHNMGAKWSYYLTRLFEETAFAFLNIRPHIKSAQDVLYIRLKMT